MNSWRDAILSNFVPNISKLTLVKDPDCLLTEEKMTLELRKRGFDLIEFNDSVEFRFAYESKYRSFWDRGEQTDLIVILCLQDAKLESLPYDLLKVGRKLSFNLGDLFPNLSYPIIEQLDRSLLDHLFDAQRKFLPESLGNNATKDFILRHVFGIAAELITNEVNLLRTLLQLHYGKLKLLPILSERLTKVLDDSSQFKTWILSELILDEDAFFAFLQERWPLFLSKLNNQNTLQEDRYNYGIKYPGSHYLPFDHPDIKVYIDNLFLEGKLTPIPFPHIQTGHETWIKSGIATTDKEDRELRISRLFDLVEREIPTKNARHTDWSDFALKWAELSSLVYGDSNAECQNRLREIGKTLNTTFASWLFECYSSLINLPATNPVMLHHVPRRLARDIEDCSSERVALIVVDGLALDQWVTLRQLLQKQDTNLVMRETAVFAWIPTLTSVSRQSIFSGKPPLYFPSSINSTNSEEKLWKQFWESYGLSRLDVTYCRGLGDGDVSSILNSLIHPTKTRVVGLVVDKIDKIMHGMQLGTAGMHNQITQWCHDGFLISLIHQLLDYNYDVWLTSDHGNIQCEGQGSPSEGAVAEIRGERVRVYPTPELRSQFTASFSFAHEWSPVGLPSDYFPLVTSTSEAFIQSGETIVGHGGIAIEEVIVPLVEIERKTR